MPGAIYIHVCVYSQDMSSIVGKGTKLSRDYNQFQTEYWIAFYQLLTIYFLTVHFVHGSVHKGGAQNVTFHYTSIVVLKL